MARTNQEYGSRFFLLGLCMAGEIVALSASGARAAQRNLEHRTAAEYGSVAADFDGDGKDDVSVKTDRGTWRIDFAHNGFGAWDVTYLGYGGLEAVPVPANYDGDPDGAADLAVAISYFDLERGAYRIEWSIDYSRDGFGSWNRTVNLPGVAGARAVPADYDGEGHADLAIKGDDGVWRIDYYGRPIQVQKTVERGSSLVPVGEFATPYHVVGEGYGSWDAELPAYGGEYADPVPADYDGDGAADLSVKDNSGYWYIDYAIDGFGSWNEWYTHRGDAYSRPVPADYDGDGRADLAVKQDAGTWYVDYWSNGFASWDASFPAGPGARPIPANYDGVGGVELAVRPDCGAWSIRRPPSALVNRHNQWQQIGWTDAWRYSRTVTDRADLIATLTDPEFQGVVNISGDIDVTPPFQLPNMATPVDTLSVGSCIHLKGTRAGLDPGALLYETYLRDRSTALAVEGHNVAIEGLRFQGASNGGRSPSLPGANAITIYVNATTGQGRNVRVAGNEFWYWTGAAVEVIHVAGPSMTPTQASLIAVTRNYFHENAREDLGYGVCVSGGYAYIEGNLFDRNRHAVAASGAPNSGYSAWYNYVLEGGYKQDGYWNQHFDVHGTGTEDPGYGGCRRRVLRDLQQHDPRRTDLRRVAPRDHAPGPHAARQAHTGRRVLRERGRPRRPRFGGQVEGQCRVGRGRGGMG